MSPCSRHPALPGLDSTTHEDLYQGRFRPVRENFYTRAAKNPGTVAIPGFALARKEGFELPGRGFILYFCISKSSNKFAFLQLSLHYVAKGFNQFYRDKGQNKGRE